MFPTKPFGLCSCQEIMALESVDETLRQNDSYTHSSVRAHFLSSSSSLPLQKAPMEPTQDPYSYGTRIAPSGSYLMAMQMLAEDPWHSLLLRRFAILIHRRCFQNTRPADASDCVNLSLNVGSDSFDYSLRRHTLCDCNAIKRDEQLGR